MKNQTHLLRQQRYSRCYLRIKLKLSKRVYIKHYLLTSENLAQLNTPRFADLKKSKKV